MALYRPGAILRQWKFDLRPTRALVVPADVWFSDALNEPLSDLLSEGMIRLMARRVMVEVDLRSHRRKRADVSGYAIYFDVLRGAYRVGQWGKKLREHTGVMPVDLSSLDPQSDAPRLLFRDVEDPTRLEHALRGEVVHALALAALLETAEDVQRDGGPPPPAPVADALGLVEIRERKGDTLIYVPRRLFDVEPRRRSDPPPERMTNTIIRRRRRQYTTRGHWRYYLRRASGDCPGHAWETIDEKRQRCSRCGARRTWIEEHDRGDPAMGRSDRVEVISA